MTPPKKKGHEGHMASRDSLCVVCLNKKDRSLSKHYIEGLKQFTTIFDSISPEDPRVPTGLCNTCRSALQLKMQGKGESRQFQIPEGFTFSSQIILPKTRLSGANFCSCLLCEIASQKIGKKEILKEFIKSRLASGSSTTETKVESETETKIESQTETKLESKNECTICFTVIS